MNTVLIFCIILILSKYSTMRLGGEDAEPEFRVAGWFAMLFSAGMGIGLLFYGVAVPMFHYVANPLSEPGTPESAQKAMELTFLHWGFHPWAIYAMVGLRLAFIGFSKGLHRTAADMEQLMLWIEEQKGVYPADQARRWIRHHRDKVEARLP